VCCVERWKGERGVYVVGVIVSVVCRKNEM
jgi:hypothetical protein